METEMLTGQISTGLTLSYHSPFIYCMDDLQAQTDNIPILKFLANWPIKATRIHVSKILSVQ